MDALHQIIGCVVSSKPASERIDDFVAQVRRERAVVLHKDAQSATFVRFSAPDVRLVALACQAVAATVPPALRFGFAHGAKEPVLPGEDGASASHRTIAQAAELAAGARDGEVLVSPDFALRLIESGYALRSKKVRLPDGRVVAACALDLAAAASHANPVDGKAGAALGGVFRALKEQAGELVRHQSAIEARLDARLARLEGRLHALEGLEARLGPLQADVADAERRLQAVQLEVQALHEVGSRTRSDLEFVAAQRDGLADLRVGLEDLQGRAREADGHLARIASHREALESVQARADAVGHMLGDLQVNLEMLGEQRAVVDHVGEKLSRLDFTVKEAQNTLRALQREREVAERIEQGIRTLRHRSVTNKPA